MSTIPRRSDSIVTLTSVLSFLLASYLQTNDLLVEKPKLDATQSASQYELFRRNIKTEPEPIIITNTRVTPHQKRKAVIKRAQLVKYSQSQTRPTAQVFEVTAYTAGAESTGKGPSHPAYGITASGKRVQRGVTVACPPRFAFGTRLRIEGVGVRVCHDRGGAIKGNRLDVYFKSLNKALQFGRKQLKVEVLG